MARGIRWGECSPSQTGHEAFLTINFRAFLAAEWLRRHLHPRWEALANGRLSLSVVAVILVLMGGSLLVLGAIPVAAPLVGLPIALFAFGILAWDGAVAGAGYGLIVLTLAGLWLLRSNAG